MGKLGYFDSVVALDYLLVGGELYTYTKYETAL